MSIKKKIFKTLFAIKLKLILLVLAIMLLIREYASPLMINGEYRVFHILKDVLFNILTFESPSVTIVVIGLITYTLIKIWR